MPSMFQNISLHLQGVMVSPCCAVVHTKDQRAQRRENCVTEVAFEDDWDLRGSERRKGVARV